MRTVVLLVGVLAIVGCGGKSPPAPTGMAGEVPGKIPGEFRPSQPGVGDEKPDPRPRRKKGGGAAAPRVNVDDDTPPGGRPAAELAPPPREVK